MIHFGSLNRRWLVAFYFVSVMIFSGVVNAKVVTHDLIVLYDFTETSGAIIHDRNSITPKLDLTIEDPTKVQWLNPGLRINEGTVALAINSREKLMNTKGITIEVWLKPLNNTQGGPARIVTFSKDNGDRNFTFGQQSDHWNQRFRTSDNPGNGTSPSLSTPVPSIQSIPALQHVVYTRTEEGLASFYIDGMNVRTDNNITGDLSNWNQLYGFGLFNEASFPVDTRTWLGDIFKVAVYGAVLTETEITQNFKAGIFPVSNVGEITLQWDPVPTADSYRLYWGRGSRTADIDATAIVEKYDALAAKFCGRNQNISCKESWGKYCTEDGDPFCDRDYFQYENSLDVGNVTEYALTVLGYGVWYFSITAFEEEGDLTVFSRPMERESKYSIELAHEFVILNKPDEAPNSPTGFIIKCVANECQQ